MLKRFSFWLWATAVFQFLNAAFHSLTFFVKEEPANETEKQLHELLVTYKKDLGAGFHATMMDFFICFSACFVLLCLLGGLINMYLWKKKTPVNIMKGVMLINVIIFGALFVMTLFYTFLIPIICSGLMFMSSVGAWFAARYTRNKE
jgi:hypothetical protein